MMTLLTRFKWGVVLFLGGLAIGPLFSQSTTVSVTVVDQGGQVWTNGTISYVFQGNGSFGGKYQWNGANLPNQYLTPQIVSLNGSGFATFTVPSSTAITPSGSSWRYVVCPNASAINCPIINIPAVGGTQNISSTVTANAPAISMNPTPMPLAYSDSEVQTVPNQGGIYFNTTSLVPKYWDGTTWHVFGSGGGGGTPALPFLSVQYNNNGAFGALPCTTDSGATQLGCFFGNTLGTSGTYISLGDTCTRTALPGLIAGTSIADSYCLFISGIDTYSGWSLGNSTVSGGGAGWYNSVASNIDVRYQNAGIKAGQLIGMRCAGVGDCNVIDANPLTRGGTSANSDEGFTYQLKLLEDIQTSGTVQTAGGGTGANTLTVNKNQNTDGIGQLIIDTTDDVISTTITAVTTASTYATITVPATVPVSTVCSTVISDVPVPVQPEGTFSLQTINLNTGVNLSTAASSHFLLTTVSPYIETNKLVSAGTFTGTTQTVTVMLNKSIMAGSAYCIGGMSGRGLEQVPFTISGQKYVMRVVGSPTNHTMEVTYMTAQGPKPDYVGYRSPLPMAVNIFHSATIVGGVATSNTLNITDNDAAWSDAANWISPNYITNTFVYNISEVYTNPYTIDLGFAHAVSGLALFGQDSFSSKNQNANGNYLSFGGIYTAPIALHIYGQHGAGLFFDEAPEDLLENGVGFLGAVISMGPIPGGSSTTDMNMIHIRSNADRFFYTPGTRTWGLIGTGGFTIGGSQVCTAANGFCTGAGTVTHTGTLTLNKFALGNNGADIKVDTVAGTDGVGNGVFASITTGAGSAACGTATSCFAALEASTAGTPTAGSDYFRASSTTHQWLMSLNNSAEFVSLMNYSTVNLSIGTAGGAVGNLPNANLATQTANTVLGALTATTPSGLAVPSCSGASNALIWTTGTGFGCNTISGSSPLTTKGDLFTFSTINGRLPIGADTFVLIADSTQTFGMKWAAATSGFANPMTTAGDLILATAGGTATRLGIGSNTFVLTSNGTTASWQAAAAGGTPAYPQTVTGCVSGGILYGSLSTQVTCAPLITAGQAVISGGAATAPTGFVVNGAGAGIVTGPSSTTSLDLACFTGTAGQITDGGAFICKVSGLTVNTTLTSKAYATASNCASATSPAVCSTASAGRVVIAAGATTVQVNTTAVTANSIIIVQPDDTLGTALSVTCNTTLASIGGPIVTGRTTASNFTISITGTLVTNPACYTYTILN